jgi:hypothetical protein
MVFSQFLYQSKNVKNRPSSALVDILIGYDRQMNSKWHLRFEGGYQKEDQFVSLNNFERFLPTEYFAALANIYEVHPLVKINGTLVYDIKSGFSYLIAKAAYNITSNTDFEIFGFTPVAKGDNTDNAGQKLVTTDIGLALRTFF